MSGIGPRHAASHGQCSVSVGLTRRLIGEGFTASTSFANPAVTLARAFTDTFAGIRSIDAPAFVVAQVLGGLSAALLLRWLTPSLEVSQHNALAASGSTAQ
jgi:glycerol uptake facilitator-like aquaporin